MTRKPEEKPVENDTAKLEDELSTLRQKYSVLQNYIKELEASGTEVPEEAKSATEVKPTETAVDTGKYIYVDDWGIKIKLPEELALVTYSYDYSNDGPVAKAGDGASLCISGSEDNSLYVFSHAGKSSGLICIERYSKQIDIPNTMEIFHDSNDWYYLLGTGVTGFRTEENTMARNYEISIGNLFSKHFLDPTNYSAI